MRNYCLLIITILALFILSSIAFMPASATYVYVTKYEMRGASLTKRYDPNTDTFEFLDPQPDWTSANNFTISVYASSNFCTGAVITILQESNYDAGSKSIDAPSISREFQYNEQELKDSKDHEEIAFTPWDESRFMVRIQNLDPLDDHSLQLTVSVNWWISIQEKVYLDEDDDSAMNVFCFSIVFLFWIIIFIIGFIVVRLDINKHLKALKGAFKVDTGGDRVDEAKKKVMPKFLIRMGAAAAILLVIGLLWGLNVFVFNLCNFIIYMAMALLTAGLVAVFIEADVRVARSIGKETDKYAAHVMSVMALTSKLTPVQEHGKWVLLLDLQNNSGGPINNIALAPQFDSGSATLSPPQINIQTMYIGEVRQEKITVQKFSQTVSITLRGFGTDKNNANIPLDTNTATF